jgi:stage V sporulation protein G
MEHDDYRHQDPEGRRRGETQSLRDRDFESCFVVHNVKVIQGESGVFIAMPSRRTKNGEYKDVAHPINTDFRARLQEQILEAYDQAADAPVTEEEEE